MKSILNPYLHFKDNARAAMEFYQSVFGGKLDMNTFGEFKMSEDPAYADKIMHAMLTADNGMVLMASDTPPGMPMNPGMTISISLSGDNEAELQGYWDKLRDGATITAPLSDAPWGDKFGMLVDKFGIEWLVDIGPSQK